MKDNIDHIARIAWGEDIGAKHVANLRQNLNVSPQEEQRRQDEWVSPIADTSHNKRVNACQMCLALREAAHLIHNECVDNANPVSDIDVPGRSKVSPLLGPVIKKMRTAI